MKTLIDINRETWAQVKYIATSRKFSLNKAVEVLLKKALKEVTEI
jgi:hypothetical protein